jgi:hypothetical protein
MPSKTLRYPRHAPRCFCTDQISSCARWWNCTTASKLSSTNIIKAMLEGSSITMCPTAPDLPPGMGGLWCRHVPFTTRPATQQGRAPVSPHVLWLQTRLQVQEGSSIATCPMALGPPPGKDELRCCHVSCGSRPASRCRRAQASPRAPWPSAYEACPCIPKVPNIRLIMATPSTRSRQRIKCVQDKPYVAYG